MVVNKLRSIGRTIRTVRHLRAIQVVYQVKSRLIKPKKLSYYKANGERGRSLPFFPLPEIKEVLKISNGLYQLNFLNLSQTYQNKINWNEQIHGKLWNYNLQYVDFLRQKNIQKTIKVDLLLDLYQELWSGILPLEPYPASLRIMNIIRFLSGEVTIDVKDALLQFLGAEVNYLSKNLEYHLLGNHLLENLFALLMGGHFFQNTAWKEKAEKLLKIELDEQILEDGAHFELSPMYHQIMFFRVLEALNYIPKNTEMYQVLRTKAQKMMAWLTNISFIDGSIPHFNDSTEGIAFSTPQLLGVAKQLELMPSPNGLINSGYRKFQQGGFEMVMDVHGISPAYQPGHAHADTFSFLLSYEGRPIIVHPGISTYNKGPRRDWERSTNAHNTIEINDKSSSEVWAGFRVGKRANVQLVEDGSSAITAFHDGYLSEGIRIGRGFFKTKKGIRIEDQLIGFSKEHNAVSFLHFHPDVDINIKGSNHIQINEQISIKISDNVLSEVEFYDFCLGYNKTTKAKRLKATLMEKNCKIMMEEI